MQGVDVMKKVFRILFVFLFLLILAACKEESYLISVNDNIVTEYYLGEENIDYKSFFTITNSKGKSLEIDNTMIDITEVDVNKVGTYKVIINYKGQEKEVSIKISNQYFITLNPNAIKTIIIGDDSFDYKQLFVIKDIKNELVEVKDEMIDIFNVDINKEGTYFVKIEYENAQAQTNVTVENTYEIKVNDNLPSEFIIGHDAVNFKPYFTLTDATGKNVTIVDSMISSNINYNQLGTYKVRLDFKGYYKEIEVKVIPAPITYDIIVNFALPTSFTLGVKTIDFKDYFIIMDSNVKLIPVTDAMLDLTSVDLTKVGTFTITIKAYEIVKTLEFRITAPYNMHATELFISEYGEGKDYNKYIEIFNGTGSSVSLNKYSLHLYNNSKYPPQYVFELSGSLDDGKILVVYHSQANKTIKNNGDLTDQVINFNGNDVIALYKGDVLIDVVGDLTNPVDDGWNIGDITNATKDHILIRRSNIYSPNANWNEDEWLVLANEDFSDLKKHTMDFYKPSEDEEENPTERIRDLFISEYFEGDGDYKDSKYIEIYNPFDDEVDLSSYALAVYKNGSTTAEFIQQLSGTLLSQNVYLVYAPYSHNDIKAVGNLASEVCYFNGKSAIALLKNGEIIDVVGVIGEYPEEGGWLVDDFSTTANNTLLRKETIFGPTNVWNPNEWYPCYDNYLYGLGYHNQIDQVDIIYNNFDAIFNMMKDLSLDSKGTAISEKQIKIKGTIFMDVQNETTLVYITDGKNFIKLHGDKIHNYTTPGQVYEILCYYQAYIYQPTLDVVNPSTDITLLTNEDPIDIVEVKEVTLLELLSLKKEDFALNITNGYLQSLIKVSGYLQLDTHNSSKYDYALTTNETYTKNHTGYINNGLYFKNDVEELDEYLMYFEVVNGEENIEINIYGIIYDWNPNRNNWRIYVYDDFTIGELFE